MIRCIALITALLVIVAGLIVGCSSTPPAAAPAQGFADAGVIAESTPTETPTETPPEPTPTATATIVDTRPEYGLVTNVIDGDTIDVEINGANYRVRYILIDTPERGMPYYDEATAANSALVLGQVVTLVKDVSETDRYGRLLRYVYLTDGTFVNAELVRQGYAQIATFPPDVAMEAEIRAAQQEAITMGRGLWADQGEDVVVNGPVDESTDDEGPGCDPAYPDPGVCIPPISFAGDLDCGEIAYRRFTVLSPDPHGFDRDNDGIGCESN